jgi:hypothetical protein
MKRRLYFILIDEKLNKCFERLKAEWQPKLVERGVDMIPTNKEAFAELVFAQPDYQNRTQRDADEEAKKKSTEDAA